MTDSDKDFDVWINARSVSNSATQDGTKGGIHQVMNEQAGISVVVAKYTPGKSIVTIDNYQHLLRGNVEEPHILHRGARSVGANMVASPLVCDVFNVTESATSDSSCWMEEHRGCKIGAIPCDPQKIDFLEDFSMEKVELKYNDSIANDFVKRKLNEISVQWPGGIVNWECKAPEKKKPPGIMYVVQVAKQLWVWNLTVAFLVMACMTGETIIWKISHVGWFYHWIMARSRQFRDMAACGYVGLTALSSRGVRRIEQYDHWFHRGSKINGTATPKPVSSITKRFRPFGESAMRSTFDPSDGEDAINQCIAFYKVNPIDADGNFINKDVKFRDRRGHWVVNDVVPSGGWHPGGIKFNMIPMPVIELVWEGKEEELPPIDFSQYPVPSE